MSMMFGNTVTGKMCDDVGGGAFGGGAFGGMGFLPPASQDGVMGVMNTATPAHPLVAKSKDENKSVTPITCAMFHRAIRDCDGPDQKPTIGGREITNVTVVAKIINIKENPSYHIFTLDDCTALVEVKKWVDPEDGRQMEQLRSTYTVNKYIRVVGQMRSYRAETFILAHHMNPVEGAEISCHIIEVIATQKMLSQLKPAAPQIAAPQNSGFPGQPLGPREVNPFQSAQIPAQAAQGNKLTVNEIINLFKTPEDADGFSMQRAFEIVKQRFPTITEGEFNKVMEEGKIDGYVHHTSGPSHFRIMI